MAQPESASHFGQEAVELTDEVIQAAKEGLENLLIARNPNTPITTAESGSIDTLLGVVVAAGFQKGKWLSNREHDSRRIEQFDHLPYGYPT